MLHTPRLLLIPTTVPLVQADRAGRAALAMALGYAVPPSWPPALYDDEAATHTLAQLQAHPASAGWLLYYIVCPSDDAVVGVAGYKGPPDAQGSVEIGYSVLADFQRRGYATEAVQALVDHAFAHPTVDTIIADTLPDLTASIAVLQRCGFAFIGQGMELGVIRYGLSRAAYQATRVVVE